VVTSNEAGIVAATDVHFPPSSPPRITQRYAIYALLVIFAANFLSYLDRQVVSALEKPLEAEFHLSKSGFGLLWTAFTVGYMVFAPVVGLLMARHHRPRVFGTCVFIWSLATMWSGWATTVPELYAARFFIGIGEAGCLVIGPTLISDYFSKEVRGKALAVFFLGLPLGGVAGYGTAAVVTMFFGTWRDAFYFAGLPGLLLAALVWFLVDPPRGGESADAHGHGNVKFEGFAPYLTLLKNRTLMLIILAQAFAVVILVPLLHFGVGYMQDKYKMDILHATLSIGSISLVAGCLGNWLSGVIGDRLAKRFKGAYAMLAGIAYIAGAPLLILGFSTDSVPVMLAALMAGAFCFFLCMPAVNTQIANSVPFQLRAMAFAMAVFILHLLGDMFAPYLFGRVYDILGERAPLIAAGATGTVGAASPISGAAPFIAVSTAIAERMHRRVIRAQIAFIFFSCSLFLAGICSLLAMRTARHDESMADAPKRLPPPEGDPPPSGETKIGDSTA
jgi:MFS family permease